MTRDNEIRYPAVAYLRDGRFRAVVAAVATLHDQGIIEAGKPGMIRLRRQPHPADLLGGFEKALCGALHGAVSPSGLAERPPVRRALDELRQGLCADGLLRRWVPARPWLPARTGLGRLRLEQCRQVHPWPAVVERPQSPVALRVGWPVALYGNAALLQLMPGFARAGGLLDRDAGDDVSHASPDNPGFNYPYP